MRSRAKVVLLLPLLAFAVFACSGSGSSDGVPPGPLQPTNTPIDSSGDGRSDLVIVDGDYNGNGVVSMQDIEEAARALTAGALQSKEVRVLGPHVYGVADVPDPTALPRFGLLELDSNSVLECRGGAVLEGWGETAPEGAGAVLVNRDRVYGNGGIRVRGCTIDGGQPEVTYDGFARARMGVRFDGCDDCSIEDSILRNTSHACFYTRHGTNNRSIRNRYENCGGHLRGVGTQGQPCMYVFAKAGRTTRGAYSMGDVMLGCGAPGFNVRREDATASISDVRFSDAIVEDTLLPANPVYRACFNLKGSSGGNQASNIVCRRTDGFATGWGGGPAGGYAHEDTTRNALVSGIDFEDMRGPVRLGPWTTNVVLSDASITTSGTGIVIRPPNRGLVVEEATICGTRGGIVFDTEAGAPAGLDPGDPSESTTIRDTRVGCADGDPGGGSDYDGIEVRGGGFQRLTLENVEVGPVTGDAVHVHDPAGTGTPFELSIVSGRFPGVIRGEDDASIEIRGGTLTRIVAGDRATITLFGGDFVAEAEGSEVLVGYGDLDEGFDGRITGVLADGSPLDVTASSAGADSPILLRSPQAQAAATTGARASLGSSSLRSEPVEVPGLSGAGAWLLSIALAGHGIRQGRRASRPAPSGSRSSTAATAGRYESTVQVSPEWSSSRRSPRPRRSTARSTCSPISAS